MWLVAGLGNPGDDYKETRHNAGFMVIEALAKRHSIAIRQKTTDYILGRGFMEDQKVILLKPLAFMNRSGIAVRNVIMKNEEIENLIVIHDDLDLETGDIRIRKNGAAGGHNGIKSIIDCLNSKEFIRLKIGIGRPGRGPAEKFVLQRFNKQERYLIAEAIEIAADIVPVIIARGVSYAQNKYHHKD